MMIPTALKIHGAMKLCVNATLGIIMSQDNANNVQVRM
jgi:hypothetical protein